MRFGMVRDGMDRWCMEGLGEMRSGKVSRIGGIRQCVDCG